MLCACSTCPDQPGRRHAGLTTKLKTVKPITTAHQPTPENAKPLTCSCCGASAGIFQQHFNRDTGWGICAECLAFEMGRDVPTDELVRLYGSPRIHYGIPVVHHLGREYKLMAVFYDTTKGVALANAFMDRHPGASVLCVTHERICIAHHDDAGAVIHNI